MEDFWKKLSDDLNQVEQEVLGHVVGPQTPLFGGQKKEETKEEDKTKKSKIRGGPFGGGGNTGGGTFPL